MVIFIKSIKEMETVEYFTEYLRKIGTPNFLAIGIVLIVLWLLISGIRKGLRKEGQKKDTEGNNEEE